MAVSKLTLTKSTALLTEATTALLSCSHRRLCANGKCWIPCRGRQYQKGTKSVLPSIETCNLSCWIVQKFDFSRNHCRGNPRGVHCRRYTSPWSDSFHHENPLPIAWSPMELQSHPPGCKLLTHLIYHCPSTWTPSMIFSFSWRMETKIALHWPHSGYTPR